MNRWALESPLFDPYALGLLVIGTVLLLLLTRRR